MPRRRASPRAWAPRPDDLLQVLLPGGAVLDCEPPHPLDIATLGRVVGARQRLLERARCGSATARVSAVELALVLELALQPGDQALGFFFWFCHGAYSYIEDFACGSKVLYYAG